MAFWEAVAWFAVVLLTVYGCAQMIRRMCLWLTRCPRCVECCRLAIPRARTDLAPLLRCLQCQAVWDDPAICRHTLVVLPSDADLSDETLQKLFEEAPAVIPIKTEDLVALVQQIIEEN